MVGSLGRTDYEKGGIVTKLRTTALLALVAAVWVAAAWGQANTSLRGTVADQTGALVPKAQVTLTSATTGLERRTMTRDAGEYEFLQVPPGRYKLVVEVSGFKKYEANDLQLEVNNPATVNVTLEVGGTTEVVAVTAEAPLLNSVDASIGAVITENQVKQLPLEARDVAALYSVQPGVVYLGNRPDMDAGNDTRSGAVNGAHSDQSNILLDGVDVNDQTRGFAFTSVLRMTPDAMQEFRVQTTNYDAQGGRSSGAQVSIVTKGGSNDFHGSLYEYHRNTATTANDYFIKLSQLENGQPNKPPQLIRNIFGGSLGGPIKKDRAFFFLNYEGRRDAQAESALRVVPSPTLRQGIMQYQYCTVDLDSSGNCPGAVKAFSLSPQQLAQMDPLGIGPNPTMLNFFQSYPMPNDTGAGDGLNYDGYRFAAPVHNSFDTYIARFDYMLTQTGNHTLFWRGNMQQDNLAGVPYLPGQSPLTTSVDHSKGFVAGYSAVLTPNLINNFRYGLTRQSQGVLGNSDVPWIRFRGLTDAPANFAYSHAFTAPVHNFVNDLSWKKGSHSLAFGTNIRLIRNPRTSLLSSFSDGVTNASWLTAAGIANTGTFMDPPLSNFPAVLPAFNNSYDYPLIALLGSVSQGDATYNYDRQGNLLAQGTPVKRHFGADEFEFYAQDSYRITSHLTITYGLRYELLSPPWETTGLQVGPNVDMGKFFLTRAQNMAKGIPSNADPTISFDLAGPANGKRGFYNWDYNNFAPRLGIAYLPSPKSGFLKRIFGDGKTAIRAGFGVVYDHIGAGLLNSFDSQGSYGLSTLITNPPANLGLDTAPRLTSLNVIPSAVIAPAPKGGYPQTPPSIAGNIFWGLDNSLRTPYSYQLSFSISRELPKNLVFEASYVGHLAHKLLAQEDLAMPLNLRDPASGVDYFTAAKRFSQLAAANTPVSAITPDLVGSTAAYWTNLYPNLPNSYTYDNSLVGLTPLQAAYSVMSGFLYNETTGTFVLDYPASEGGACDNGCSKLGPNIFYNPQYASLYAWRSIGNSSYHAAQLTLRKRFSQGMQFDFNYTFSKSIDLSSDAERIGPWSGLGGQVINSWDYKALRALSDFDTTHQINANWVWELPFGRSKRFGRGANAFADALIGGWQLSGIFRWTTGFPVSVFNGATWPTNWQLGGAAMPSGTTLPHTAVYKNGDGTVNLFSDASKAILDFRHDYPGESGIRNNLRGDGVFGWDMGLGKRWKMPYAEGHSVQFRWEVFNVPNTVRFDVQSANLNIDNATAFGKYTRLLSNPRIMQFALRYDF
jgi:carboxypeptidase family protein